MTDSQPSIIVVVPTLGERPETLLVALSSVRDQRGVEIHLVVVVPGAAHAARETAQACGATVVDDPKRGLSAAVNAGIAARDDEEFYAWLGDDDLLLPGGLATLAGLLRDDPRAVAAYGACPYIDDEGRTIRVSRAGDLAGRILSWGPDLVPQPASLTRLGSLVEAGEYDESLRFAMDLDMFLRLKKQGPLVRPRKQEVAAFRWHADSLTVANRALSLRGVGAGEAAAPAEGSAALRVAVGRAGPLGDPRRCTAGQCACSPGGGHALAAARLLSSGTGPSFSRRTSSSRRSSATSSARVRVRSSSRPSS